MARRLTARPSPAWVGDLPVFERTLANGFKALVLPRTHAPVVICDLYYPVGSVNEPAGKTGLAHFDALTKGREQEIETAFAADVDQTELSRWVDNSTMEQGNDLGYWVGYRIAKAYYQRAADKQQAVREILEVSDPKAFLAKSGWRPGMEL